MVALLLADFRLQKFLLVVLMNRGQGRGSNFAFSTHKVREYLVVCGDNLVGKVLLASSE